MTAKTRENIGLDVQIKDELDRAIDELNLFDDDLMSKVFDENIEATELLLRIILEQEGLWVTRTKGQVEMKSPYSYGRSIRLDIHAIDRRGVQFNVEIQRNEEGSHIRRARFHGSMMDIRMLKRKQQFKELKDAYVIFICQHDRFGADKPIYHVDKVIRETGNPYDDGAYTIYVNGQYKGDDAFGRLAHDFRCTRADDAYYKPLAEGLRHFKETKKGRDEMCESFSRLADKVADERQMITRIDDVCSLMKTMKLTLEQALNALQIQDNERVIIAERLQKLGNA